MKKTDFFFGEKTGAIELYNINEIAETVSIDFFSTQLNRYLSENNGHMEVRCDVSCPSFSDFLGKVNKECIGNIKIYARTDLNNAVNATLSCEILMSQGVVTFTTQWCAYTDMRAKEIISTLLVPIHLINVQSKTYLKWNDETLEPLFDGSLDEEVFRVFSLAHYPHCSIEKKYIERLKYATEIGSKGLSMKDAQKEHFDKININSK